MKEDISPIIFETRNKLRSWLKKNHDKVDVAWFAINKKNSKIKCITYAEALEEALCFGWIDGIVKRYNDDYYMQRFTPRKAKSKWSAVNKGKIIKLIEEGKMIDAGYAKIEEAKRNGQWEKTNENRNNQVLPDDLKFALMHSKFAWKNFSAFAPGYQRLYIAWVNSVKKEDARNRRIANVVERSEKNEKPGML
ncbi:MAG: YdeI/OmpD-associated family protein [Bacteroidales bacterium]|jgi:uncharacterized protein YdeI (YjbR/CyaY-like superfamily)